MTRSRFSRLVAVAAVSAAGVLGTAGTFGTAAAAPGGDDFGPPVDVAFGESDAESILLLHAYYPGYWWDHADLTIAVLNAPNVDDENYDAIREAIETWSEVLAEEFDGAITLTDVTETARNPQRADIVVHYVPHAGGSQWGGYAVCGAKRCNNIIVRSDVPDLIDVGVPDYDPQRVYRVALHEIGHALGLGHAEPLEETNDLMGYGWSVPEPDTTPILSQCDLDALRYEVFAWVFEGVDPYPSTAPEYVCDPAG
jgi:hypothetical protein